MTKTNEQKQEETSIALKLSGAGYMLGDIGGIAASYARGAPDSLKGYAVWFAGGLAAAAFGNPSQQQQLEITAHKLQNYLQDRGVVLPQTTRDQHALLAKPGFLSPVMDFLREHPSEMLNTMFGIGAGFLLKDGLSNKGAKKIFPSLPKSFSASELSQFTGRTNNMFWMGTSIGAGALSGLLIKENPAAREEAKNGSFTDKILAYFQEKPLRLSSTLYAANNVFAVLQAASDYHHRGSYKGLVGMKPHIYSGALAGTYVLSNLLLHTVSRDQSAKGGYDGAAMMQLEEAAATIIASQPPEKQQQVLQDVSAFLATQKAVNLQAPQIAQQLAARIVEKSKARLLAVPSAFNAPINFVEKEAQRAAHAAETSHQI